MKLYKDCPISDVLFEAIKLSRSGYTFKNKKNCLSTTTIISPVKHVILKTRHDDEILEPVSKVIRSFVGTSTHKALELVKLDGLLSEERLELEFEGFTISGAFDILRLTDDYNLEDLKVVSYYSYIYDKKGKLEHEIQLNIYRYLIWKCMGIKVRDISIIYLYYDWLPSIVSKNSKAPKYPEMSIKFRVWDDYEVEVYLRERIKLFQEAQDLPDDDIPTCTPKERWSQPKKYRAIKKGNKKATKVFYKYGDLQKFLHVWQKKNVEFDVEVIEPKDSRCIDYCFANSFCNYYKDKYMDKE